MPTDHTEKGFENAVTAHLLAGGYVAADPAEFDAKFALAPSTLVRFLQTSQPKEWGRLVAIYGGEVEAKVVGTIPRDLDQRGMLDCLRHGVTDRGVKLTRLLPPGDRPEPENAGPLLARESQDGKDVAKKAAALQKKYAGVHVLMRVYGPRSRGGLGFGPRAEPLEARLLELGERSLSAAALKGESAELLRVGHVNLVVAEVVQGYAPKKRAAGRGKAEWERDVANLKKASKDFLDAVKAADPKAVQASAARINKAYDSCHGFPATP